VYKRQIIAIDRHASRLELAAKYGATHKLSGGLDEYAPAILDATGGGSDHAFDTTGNAALCRMMFESLNNLGTLGLAGVGFGELSFSHLSMIGGRTVTGVMEGDSVPREFIPRLAQMNVDGQFPFHELIGEFAFDDINAAEAATASGEVIKPVLPFGWGECPLASPLSGERPFVPGQDVDRQRMIEVGGAPAAARPPDAEAVESSIGGPASGI